MLQTLYNSGYKITVEEMQPFDFNNLSGSKSFSEWIISRAGGQTVV